MIISNPKNQHSTLEGAGASLNIYYRKNSASYSSLKSELESRSLEYIRLPDHRNKPHFDVINVQTAEM